MAGKSKGPDKRTSAGHSDKKHLPADAGLWEQVKKTVTPIKPKKKPSTAPAPVTGTASGAAKKITPSAGGVRRTSTPVTPPPRVTTPSAPAPTPFDRATLRRLTRGDDGIEGRIDLHGMTQAQAHQRLKSFVLRAQAKGQRTLLVITGKGRLSEGGGILKRQLPLWLESPDLAPLVLSYGPARAKDGGSGAFYLRLRKSKK